MQLAHHLEQSAWNAESWASIDFKVRQDMRPTDGERGSVAEHYIEKATGERYYDHRITAEDGRAIYLVTYYFDGRRGLDLTFDKREPSRQLHGVVHRHFANESRGPRAFLPVPLLYNKVGLLSVHEALPGATPLGETQVLRRTCDQFLFPQAKFVPNMDLVYSLDRESSIPLKVEAYLDEAGRATDQPIWGWTATRLDTIQGRPVVVRSEQREFMPEEGELKLHMVRTFTIEEAAFDKDHPPATFWPVLQAGVKVFNPETGEVDETLGGPVPAADTSNPTTSLPATGPGSDAVSIGAPPPIRAEVPRPWTTYTAPVGLTLGTAALIAGFILMIRRR